MFARRQRGDGKQLEPDEVKQVSLDLAAPIPGLRIRQPYHQRAAF
jgi:hypothetical protein